VEASETDVARVVAVIAEAWQEGSPVAASDDERRREMAAVATRRWESFERRAKSRRAGMDERVEDLAKGLRDAYEPDSALAGPLMTDYRWLAERIAAALTDSA
jgi:hypothetical protein